MDPNVVGPATLALTQAIGSFNTFLPSIADIRKKAPDDDPEFAADVRMGEIAAVGVTLGVGVIMSGLTGSNLPTVISVIVALGLLFLYESTLRAEKPLEVKA